MANTVKVPLLGTHSKGTVIGVSIGGLAVAGYMIYRNQKKAAAAAQAQDQTSAAAASGYGYGQSNFGYGYFGYGEPGLPYGYGASGGFVPGGYYGYGQPIPPGGGNVPVTTNAQWTQAAITQLQQDGYQPRAVAAALGKYINGVAVDANETGIIQAAIGVEGYPPQAGKNGNPPGIVHGSGGGGDGQKPDRDYITADGTDNLTQIGHAHQLDKMGIDRLNPALAGRYGNQRDIPKGTKVRIH